MAERIWIKPTDDGVEYYTLIDGQWVQQACAKQLKDLEEGIGDGCECLKEIYVSEDTWDTMTNGGTDFSGLLQDVKYMIYEDSVTPSTVTTAYTVSDGVLSIVSQDTEIRVSDGVLYGGGSYDNNTLSR